MQNSNGAVTTKRATTSIRKGGKVIDAIQTTTRQKVRTTARRT